MWCLVQEAFKWFYRFKNVESEIQMRQEVELKPRTEIEIGLLAAQYPDTRTHVCDRGVLLQTLAIDDKLHEVIVTNLRNKGKSLIRYQIGDLTDAPLTPAEQGTTTIGSVIG